MSRIDDAYNLVIAACNDPYIGYSMTDRRTITLGVTYRTYCDCSSLMSWALTGAGYFTSNPWFATGSQETWLARAGWYEVPISGEWLPGDIVWHPKGGRWTVGHTEMVYATGGNGKGYTMGAHWAKPVFADQVSINSGLSYASDYTKLFRSNESAPPDPGGGGGDPGGDPGKRDVPMGAIIEDLRRRLWYPGHY